MTRNDRPPPTRRGVHDLRYVRHQPSGLTALGQLVFNDAKTVPHLAQMAAERRKIVALIPAHNEQDAIRDTITSLNDQDLLPDRIIIVADNCSDDTELIACGAGVEVMVTRGNPWKKAGALNQALDRILPELKDRDLVLIQDADTNLNPGFLSSAVAAMTDDAGGVCAQYDSPPPRNVLERLQSSEFARSRRRTRLQGAGRFWQPSQVRLSAFRSGRRSVHAGIQSLDSRSGGQTGVVSPPCRRGRDSLAGAAFGFRHGPAGVSDGQPARSPVGVDGSRRKTNRAAGRARGLGSAADRAGWQTSALRQTGAGPPSRGGVAVRWRSDVAFGFDSRSRCAFSGLVARRYAGGLYQQSRHSLRHLPEDAERARPGRAAVPQRVHEVSH